MIAEIGVLTYFGPFMFISMAVAMLVLRAGASRVFFDIIGTFQAKRMIDDASQTATVLEAIYLDAITGIEEGTREISDAFGEIVDTIVPITREIEEARIQFDKFLAYVERTPAVFDEVADIGMQFGFAADEAYEASARMAQLAGTLGAGTTPLGTEIGMMFGLISGMETEEAMQRLINLQQQTKFMTENVREGASEQERLNQMRIDSIRVLDELNTVENRSAATMQQITYVMNQFASQAELTGESIAAMAAMSATLIEAGEEQGKGGRALRMIYARLGADTNGARSTIEQLGISVIDTETGAMRPFSDILEELAAKYQTLTGAEQQQLAQAVAGNRHYTRLIKLLENGDRVRELENEALTGMFPAMEEIERRRNTELFQLEQAEAQLRNYQAAFGESMLDDVKEATELQSNFYNTLIQVNENALGGILVGGFTRMTTVMQAAVSPAINLMMALYNLRIAVRTLDAVKEASATVTTQSTQAFKNEFGQIQENVQQFYLMSNAIHELRKEATMNYLQTTTQNIPSTQEELDVIREKIVILNESRMAVADLIREEKKREADPEFFKQTTEESKKRLEIEQRLTNALAFQSAQEGKNAGLHAIATGRVKEFSRQLNQTRQDSRDLEAAYKAQGDELNKLKNQYKLGDAALRKERATEHEREAKALVASANAYNSLSMSLMTAGSSMMIFSQNEKVQRAGMILNAMAAAVQIGRTLASASATIVKTNALRQEIITEKLNNIESERAIILDGMGRVAKLQAAAAAKIAALMVDKLAMSTAAAATAAGALVSVLTVGGLIIAAYALASAFGGINDELDDMGAGLSSVGTAAELALGQTPEMIRQAIKENQAIIDEFKDAEGDLAKAQVETAEQNVANLLGALDYSILANTNRQQLRELADAYGKNIEDYERSLDIYGGFDPITGEFQKGSFMAQLKASVGIDDLSLSEALDANTAATELDKMMETSSDLLEVLHRNSIRSGEELDGFVSRMIESAEQQAVDSASIALNGVNNIITGTTDQLYEFNNAREELFYGFSSSRVTGDLVKQVHQQGVETLINTTEVIMNNNFNGLTIPEVADKIIEEIESRGNMLGYSIS